MRVLAALVFSLAGVSAQACQDVSPDGLAFPASLTRDARPGASIIWAHFAAPTDVYTHAILGDGIEPQTLVLAVSGGTRTCSYPAVAAGEGHVFEDVAPRLVDLDGDGASEVIVVRTSVTQGAQLAVYGVRDRAVRLIAATPYIGRSRRWLAPVGAADLDGDGRMEIAYVDRPHLAKVLRVWRFENDGLTELAAASGLTNHRIGEDFISGGMRDCGGPVEMITANANWTRIIATQLVGGTLIAREVGPFTGRVSMQAALGC